MEELYQYVHVQASTDVPSNVAVAGSPISSYFQKGTQA